MILQSMPSMQDESVTVAGELQLDSESVNLILKV